MLDLSGYGFPDVTFLPPWLPAAGLCKLFMERYLPLYCLGKDNEDVEDGATIDFGFGPFPLDYNALSSADVPPYFLTRGIGRFMTNFDGCFDRLFSRVNLLNPYRSYGKLVASTGEFINDFQPWTWETLLAAATVDDIPIDRYDYKFLPTFYAKWALQRYRMLRLLTTIGFTAGGNFKAERFKGGDGYYAAGSSFSSVEDAMNDAISNGVCETITSSGIGHDLWYYYDDEGSEEYWHYLVYLTQCANLQLKWPSKVGFAMPPVSICATAQKYRHGWGRKIDDPQVGPEYHNFDIPMNDFGGFEVHEGSNFITSANGIFFQRTLPYDMQLINVSLDGPVETVKEDVEIDIEYGTIQPFADEENSE